MRRDELHRILVDDLITKGPRTVSHVQSRADTAAAPTTSRFTLPPAAATRAWSRRAGGAFVERQGRFNGIWPCWIRLFSVPRQASSPGQPRCQPEVRLADLVEQERLPALSSSLRTLV